jgi:hypothetical protein
VPLIRIDSATKVALVVAGRADHGSQDVEVSVTRALVWESWVFDAWTAIEARDRAIAERNLLATEQRAATGGQSTRLLLM